MPNRDRTGPSGMGPRTGRGMGRCKVIPLPKIQKVPHKMDNIQKLPKGFAEIRSLK